MMSVLYDNEPRGILDIQEWERFRDEMAEEVRLHPDREEAKSTLRYAIGHLKWIAEQDTPAHAA